MVELFEKLWLILTYIIPRPITIMPDEKGLLLRFGKIVKVFEPGWMWVWKPIHKHAEITVTEQVPDIRCITAITKDDIEVSIGSAVRYTIQDPIKALYHVEDYDEALETLVVAKLHAHVNSHSYKECLKTDKVGEVVEKEVRGIATRRWGIKILGLWITDMGCKHLRVITEKGGVVPVTEKEEDE